MNASGLVLAVIGSATNDAAHRAAAGRSALYLMLLLAAVATLMVVVVGLILVRRARAARRGTTRRRTRHVDAWAEAGRRADPIGEDETFPDRPKPDPTELGGLE